MDEKKALIKKEKDRLSRQFSKIEKRKKQVVLGLIDRAAFLRVTLDELEEDIRIYGCTELFQQGENQEPYKRKRPEADVQNSFNGNYQKIIKQLTDLLPKEEAKTEKSDGFNEFVGDRD